MPVYEVEVRKWGKVKVEAPTEEKALAAAEQRPENEIAWDKGVESWDANEVGEVAAMKAE